MTKPDLKPVIESLDWKTILTWLYRLFMAGAFAGGIYAAATFVTRAELVKLIEPFADMPPRVSHLERLSAERTSMFKDLNAWQVRKDEIDTRLMVLVENQQKLIDRQTNTVERQQDQLNIIMRVLANQGKASP